MGDLCFSSTHLVKHHINVDRRARPVKQRCRRLLPLRKEAFVETEVKRFLEEDMVEEADGPWASPIVVVKKGDGEDRMCIDYRAVNDVTEKDAFPLPRIEDCFQGMAGAKYFCTLDLASGYNQIEVDEASRAISAFTTPLGLFQYKVMPFGLCKAPATFVKIHAEDTERERVDRQNLHGLS